MPNIQLANVGATSVSEQSELSLLKKEDEVRREAAATLDKEPIIHTVSKAEHSEGATADLRRVQTSIVTHSAVLCCSA